MSDEEKIAKCFGDEQLYEGGWFALYDGKWVDITNDVNSVLRWYRQEIKEVKKELTNTKEKDL